jgi:hypothetical protein
MFDFLIFFCVFIFIGELIIILFCKINNYGNKEIEIFTLGLIFRIFLTYFYYWYTLHHESDTFAYFEWARKGKIILSDFIKPGTSFVFNLSVPFYYLISFFENKYLMLFLPYSVCAFLGSLLLYKILYTFLSTNKLKKELYFLCFFAPNLIYWTTNIGKDSIFFMGIMMLLYGLISARNITSHLFYIIFGAAIIYMLRPHIFLFLILAFAFGVPLSRQKFSIRNITIFSLSLLAFFLLYQTIFSFVGITVTDEETNKNVITRYYEESYKKISQVAQNVNFGGASTGRKVINGLFSPYYLIYFYSSPFIWQVRKPFQLISALETIIYEILIVYIILNWKIFIKNKSLRFKYSFLMYIILGGVILGAAQTNFGLIVRQKCMFLPALFFLYACVRNDKIKKEISYLKH